MDLNLYLRVLWRFRLLVAVGCLLAAAAAGFVLFRVEVKDGDVRLTYRQNNVWISASTLFVTREGLPWARTTPDKANYSGLAMLYAELASSDAVRQSILPNRPSALTYDAEAVRAPDGVTVLPLISIKGMAPSPAVAETIANRAAAAFRMYVKHRQEVNGIPEKKRVELRVVNRAGPAELFQRRSIARPGAVGLLVLIALVGLAFVLENLRPRPSREAQGAAALPPEPPVHDGRGSLAPQGDGVLRPSAQPGEARVGQAADLPRHRVPDEPGPEVAAQFGGRRGRWEPDAHDSEAATRADDARESARSAQAS